jgi:hypothetical protein
MHCWKQYLHDFPLSHGRMFAWSISAFYGSDAKRLRSTAIFIQSQSMFGPMFFSVSRYMWTVMTGVGFRFTFGSD